MALRADVALVIKFLYGLGGIGMQRKRQCKAHIPQCRVDNTAHLGDPPFDDVAKVLVVDVVVLLANGTLRAFFKFILAIAGDQRDQFTTEKSQKSLPTFELGDRWTGQP